MAAAGVGALGAPAAPMAAPGPHAHVPKRATQSGLFIPSSETPFPTLKPGQRELHRKGLYTLEAKRSFAATTYLALELPAKSQYAASQKGRPEDYAFRDERARRAAEGTSPRREMQQGALTAREGVSSSCAHWQSEYKALGREAGQADLELRRLARGVQRRQEEVKVGVVGCSEDGTAYRDYFGRYGSDPREKVGADEAKMPVERHELFLGTTKVSHHIPNYQGFIPVRGTNPAVARVIAAEATRSTDKTNMADVFHKNLIGYSGHVPQSFLNDFGGRKPTTLTVHGSDYAPLKSARF